MPTSKSMWKTCLSLVAATILFSGCGDTINGKSIAEPLVVTFHERLNKGEASAIYTTASADFRKAIAQDKAEALFAAISRKLGKHKSSELINWNVKTFNLTTSVVLVYNSAYSGGEATETFSFRINDGKAEMVGYNISSLDMLIK